jgi:hypothetical protein
MKQGQAPPEPRSRETEMINNTASASNLAPEVPKSSLKSSKDGEGRGQAASKTDAAAAESEAGRAAVSTPDWTYDSKTSLSYTRTEDLYLKYTARNGDVLEVSSKTTEEFRYEEHLTISADARALAARACAKDGDGGRHGLTRDGMEGAAGAMDAADAMDTEAPAEAEALDPKEKQLKELRKWAKQVEREVRLQQHKILEQMLKQSGKDGGKDGSPFLMVTPDGVCVRPGKAEKAEDAPVPEYWNAENTSDRIVHFATQMAEISGMDLKEFGEIIKEAVSKGFDQAGAATGELTGSAAKLNKDTKDLVSSKLSKWLEERADKPYNQGAQKPATAGAASAAGPG